MIIDTKLITKICDKLRIDIRQFFFLYLIYIKDKSSMMRYVNHIEGFDEDFREILEKKGLLLDANPYHKDEGYDDEGDKKVDFKNLYSTPEFDKVVVEFDNHCDVEGAYDELLDIYPYEIVGSNGQKYNARTGTYESNSEKYLKYIKRNPDEHSVIVEATKYGRDNNLIRMGLEKYIATRYWGSLIITMQDSQNNNNNGEPKYGENEF